MKTWFITGASRGLGLEMVKAAFAVGDQIVATGRSTGRIETAIAEYGKRGVAVALDVTDPKSIKTAVDAAIQRFGRIDVLVNNAGYGQLGAFEENSPRSIERQFATNVFGVFEVTRAVLPVMRSQRSGHIITISSVGGIIGFNRASLYCATKFAVAGWSESLSLELAPFGIRTTVVHPGRFRTDFLDPSSVDYGDLTIADYAESSAAIKKSLDDENHLQIGDPVKFGRAMVEITNAKEPPIRFAAGVDAVEILNGKATSMQETTAKWRSLSESTDISEQ